MPGQYRSADGIHRTAESRTLHDLDGPPDHLSVISCWVRAQEANPLPGPRLAASVPSSGRRPGSGVCAQPGPCFPSSQFCGPSSFGISTTECPLDAQGGSQASPGVGQGDGRVTGQGVHGMQGFVGLVPRIHVAFCTPCSWLAFTLQTQTRAPGTLRGSSSLSNVPEEAGMNVLSREHADAVCGVLLLLCPAAVKKEVVRVREAGGGKAQDDFSGNITSSSPSPSSPSPSSPSSPSPSSPSSPSSSSL